MEIAFVAANRFRIEVEKKQGHVASGIVSFFTKNPGQYIATMLIGNNVSLVAYGIFFSISVENYIREYLYSSDYGVLLIQTIISTLLILVTAEFLPKTIFRLNPNRILNAFSVPVMFFFIIFYPISKFTIFVSKLVLKTTFRVDIKDNNEKIVFGKIDLDNFLAKPESTSNTVDRFENEIKIFRNALDFSKIKLKECLIPRNEIVAMDLQSDVIELSKKFIETGFSKILIYEQSIDNIVGYVHSRDLFKKPENIKSVLVDVFIAPETMRANKLLKALIEKRKNVALIVDEFGGTSGMVTIEDIIEEIFGEIEDEHDINEFTERKISDHEFIFSGRLEIDYINEKYNLNIPESEDYETIAGYIFSKHEKVPKEKEIVKIDNFSFEILKVNGPKIETVKFRINL